MLSQFEIHLFNTDGSPSEIKNVESLRHEIERGTNSLDIGSQPQKSYVGTFRSEDEDIEKDLYRTLSHFANQHIDCIVEMCYDCDEDDTHYKERYHDHDSECVDRIVTYPEYQHILMPHA